MRNKGGTKANLCAVADLDALRIFVFDVYIVADEHAARDFDPPEPVQKWTQACGAWKESRQETENPIHRTSNCRFLCIHEVKPPDGARGFKNGRFAAYFRKPSEVDAEIRAALPSTEDEVDDW